MSYILEALKKSEEKRKSQEQNSVLGNPLSASPPAIKSKRSLHLLWLIIILLLCCSTLFYFYFNSVNLQEEIVTAPHHPSPPQEIQVSKPPSNDTSDTIIELKPVKKKIVTIIKKDDPEEILQPAPLPIEHSSTTLILPETRHMDIPYLEQLPDDFKDSVPDMKLTGHVYSPDPKLRMIMINNSIVREKDVVEKSYILEEIIPDGVILRSGQTLFRVDAE